MDAFDLDIDSGDEGVFKTGDDVPEKDGAPEWERQGFAAEFAVLPKGFPSKINRKGCF